MKKVFYVVSAAVCFTAAATEQKQTMRFLQSWEGFQGKGV